MRADNKRCLNYDSYIEGHIGMIGFVEIVERGSVLKCNILPRRTRAQGH